MSAITTTHAAPRSLISPDEIAPERAWRVMPAADPEHESWRDSAACRHHDPDLFFPIGTTGAGVAEIERAKAICSGCPVQSACLTYALASHQQYGIWGGSDEDQRRQLRRRWRESGRAGRESS
jgi:WhiB family redox-sensing transcriptional regulator